MVEGPRKGSLRPRSSHPFNHFDTSQLHKSTQLVEKRRCLHFYFAWCFGWCRSGLGNFGGNKEFIKMRFKEFWVHLDFQVISEINWKGHLRNPYDLLGQIWGFRHHSLKKKILYLYDSCSPPSTNSRDYVGVCVLSFWQAPRGKSERKFTSRFDMGIKHEKSFQVLQAWI